jgi:DNA helicase-2/ATP-dependent DNA helicase PcrA
VKAVAEFQAVDGAVTLPALLAYLDAEDETGGHGLDVATPSEADSVKLLTVHRAKGLEWDVVFLVGVCRDRFPTKQGRVKWTSGPAVLPNPLRGDSRDLPVLRGFTSADLTAFFADCRKHEATEELRLGYVAFTRPRHELVVSSYCWAPGRKTGLGPSPYQEVVRTALESWGEPVPRWQDPPEKDAPNPLLAERTVRAWPAELHGEELSGRRAAAALVREEMARDGQLDLGLTPAEADLVATWDAELARLLDEAQARRAPEVEVPLPSSLSATSLGELRADPDELAAALARPMPRRPTPAARFGTRFHAWIEAYYDVTRQDLLVDPDDLPGRADLGIDDDTDLEQLVAKFRAGPFAERRPVAVEPSFALVLGGQVVRGRVDAVFAEDDGSHLVVDWKTNREHSADPVQLAVYRVAWAELHGLPLERVRAAFYYVRDGEVVVPDQLPDRAGLEALLARGVAVG